LKHISYSIYTCIWLYFVLRGRRGRECVIVGFITTKNVRMPSVHITTNVVSLNPAHGKM